MKSDISDTVKKRWSSRNRENRDILKKLIAKEWLYLCAFFLSTFFIVILLVACFGGNIFNDELSSADNIFPFFYPYILFQFIRSIIWSIKTIKKK